MLGARLDTPFRQSKVEKVLLETGADPILFPWKIVRETILRIMVIMFRDCDGLLLLSVSLWYGAM